MSYPAVPLAITANLITEADLPEPPPVEEPEPEPEPEPDTSEQDRLREEEAKRQADMREEQERIRLEEEADRKKQSASGWKISNGSGWRTSACAKRPRRLRWSADGRPNWRQKICGWQR
jgi:outer membrane biosynthesis protein TonB